MSNERIDVKLTPDENTGIYDLTITDGDFTSDDSLNSTILCSIFTDKRADSSQVFKPENRRGWIGDIAPIDPNYISGSLLWLLEQARLTTDTANKAADYVRNSLQYLIDDGIALNVQVTANIIIPETIRAEIVITAQDGSTETLYADVWRRSNAA